MIRSQFTPVIIPEVAVHDAILHACKANAEKQALVNMMLTI